MPNYRRLRVPAGTYFFTVGLADRHCALLTDHIGLLREAYRQTLHEHPFKTQAIVILPNHLHCIWTLPEADADFSTRWRKIKARFTVALRRAGITPCQSLPRVTAGRYAGLTPGLRISKRERAVWQRRFWEHQIRGPADHAEHLSYCWSDPVRHGLVHRAADWPFSSLRREIASGRLAVDWSAKPTREGDFGE